MVTLLWLSCICSLVACSGVDNDIASKLQPFFGQNNRTTQDDVTVFVSVGFEKLTDVDENKFLFEGVFR